MEPSRRRLLTALLVCFVPAQASELMPPGHYEVTTETVMPHLHESLRYATTRQTLCLSGEELASAFPTLRHGSLRVCRLDEKARNAESVFYVLNCGGGVGAGRYAFRRLP